MPQHRIPRPPSGRAVHHHALDPLPFRLVGRVFQHPHLGVVLRGPSTQDDEIDILGVYCSVEALQPLHHSVDPEEELPQVLTELHLHAVESEGESSLLEATGAKCCKTCFEAPLRDPALVTISKPMPLQYVVRISNTQAKLALRSLSGRIPRLLKLLHPSLPPLIQSVETSEDRSLSLIRFDHVLQSLGSPE